MHDRRIGLSASAALAGALLACNPDTVWLGVPAAEDTTEATGANPASSETHAPSDDTTESGDATETGEPIKFDLGPAPDDGSSAGIPNSCELADTVQSAVGCLFYAVDLDNAPSGDFEQYGVAVSNVQTEGTAKVSVEIQQAGKWTVFAGPANVKPLDAHVFELPDRHYEGSYVAPGRAYRIVSNLPVVAYQFNPLNGQSSRTTDASLLYPVSSWDSLFRVIGYPVTLNQGSYVTIVGAVHGTMVEVTPSAPTQPGVGLPAGQPGVPFWLTLDPGDVAQISTEGNGNGMTGTKVVSDIDTPIGVFSGTECTDTGLGACDHLEDMMTGIRRWGSTFVAARMPVRVLDDPEPTVWEFYVSEANTTIDVEAAPGITGLPNGQLLVNQGDTFRFGVTGPPDHPGDFVLRASRPIGLVAYMTGIFANDGDPAMVQLGPVSQFLPRYVVYVPETWENDYLVITRQIGDPVELDGALIDDGEFQTVGFGDAYEVARVLSEDGVHVIDGLGEPVGVMVVGYDIYDSYAYLGGVGTSILNPRPTG